MDFNKWLQRRLTAHGYTVAIDGAIGNETTGAIKAFQKAKGLRVTGVADARTVEKLRAIVTPDEVALPAPAELMPPWMGEMHRRMGLHEIRDNAALTAWLKIGRWLGNPKNLPWCGDAVETCIVKTLPDELVPNNPFFAQAWKDFGNDAGGFRVGAIGVIRWSATSGHVGIEAARANGKILLLGGNQSNAINLTWFPETKFIAHRWPKNYPLKSFPSLTASGASTGTNAATR